MFKNPSAVMTMTRQKLVNYKPETRDWFHEKGVTIKKEGDMFFLRSDPRGHISEMTPFFNGVVFHNQHLCAFPGFTIKETALSQEIENGTFILDESTLFAQVLEGDRAYMFWDRIDEEWKFSSDKKIKSPHTDLLLDKIYNIHSSEFDFTYVINVIESGKDKGIYLETIWNNKTFKELHIEKIIKYAQKYKLKYPNLYYLEKGQKIEETDLPLLARDISGNKIKIISL